MTEELRLNLQSQGSNYSCNAITGTYDTKDLAVLLKSSERHIRRMDALGEIPGRIKFGRSVRYSKIKIDNWLSGEGK